MPSSAGGSFLGVFGSILVYNILFFENHSIFFHDVLYSFLKTFWPLFMGRVQLSQCYRVTFLVTTKSSECLDLSITLMLSVLLIWSFITLTFTTRKKLFYLIAFSARGHFHVFLGPFCVAVCFSMS